MALLVIVNVPLKLPSLVGVKVTETVQVSPIATDVLQSLLCAKLPVTVKVGTSKPLPVLLIVMVWAALVLLTAVEAKLKLVPERVEVG